MEKERKEAKESLVATILFLDFAVLLLLNPDNFMNIAMNVFGYLGIFFGVISVFVYFRLPKEARTFTKNLTNGIILISYGVLAILNADLIEDVFTILLGGYFIFKNASRIQLGTMLYETKKPMATWILLLSVTNVVLSFLLLVNPETFKISVNLYFAILIFLCEGLYFVETIVLLIGLKKKKEEIEG